MTNQESHYLGSWVLIGLGLLAVLCGLWQGGVLLAVGVVMQERVSKKYKKYPPHPPAKHSRRYL